MLLDLSFQSAFSIQHFQPESLMRLVAWVLWQTFTLFFALLVWANLFGEYGRYTGVTSGRVALVVALIFAVIAGTIIPWRRWRRADREAQASAESPDE